MRFYRSVGNRLKESLVWWEVYLQEYKMRWSGQNFVIGKGEAEESLTSIQSSLPVLGKRILSPGMGVNPGGQGGQVPRVLEIHPLS